MSNTLGVQQAWKAINREFTLSDRSFVKKGIFKSWPDEKLELATPLELVKIARSIPKFPFIADIRDCDDFSKKFLCKAKERYPKMAVARLLTNTSYNMKVPHDACVALIKSRTTNRIRPVVVEPQRVGRYTAHLLRWPRKNEDVVRLITF